MFFIYSWWTYLILIPGLLLASYAEIKVSSAYRKYGKIPSNANWTASDCAKMLLEKYNCKVEVTKIGGHLSDHYNPSNRTLPLSHANYGSNSIAALGIAAHEVGHACQHNTGYAPLKFRNAIVPVVNIGSRLAIPLIFVGILLEYILVSNPIIGTYLVGAGIACYGLITLFSLMTLPVEFDASRRALKMLDETGVLTNEELRGAKKVLTAAALTYVASLVVAILQLVRLLLIIQKLRKKD